jgi:CubicO group peptidase (beta-lactamase class C family)
VLLTAAIVAGCVTAPVAPANSAAAREFAAWLDAVNRGGGTLQEFIDQRGAPGSRLFRSLAFREQTGGFDLVKVDESLPLRIVAQLRARSSGEAYGVALEVEPDGAHRIRRLGLGRLSAQLSEPEAVLRGRKFVEQLVAAGRFRGAVLVARNGRPVFAQAYGLADRAASTPNTLETRFDIASLGKTFTATAVLQLVAAGKLKLDHTVGAILPDYPNADVAAKVTIHQLLTHTAGTGDINWPVPPDLRTPSDFLRRFGARAPAYEPGTRWEYSNYGYILLGAIIEKASGQDYTTYLNEHVLGPAGMSLLPPRTVCGAGGGFFTVADLMRFSEALLQHRLLDARDTELLTTGKVAMDRGGVYAYGLLDTRADGGAWFGHGGGAPGISSDLRIYPWSGYVVVALANMDPPITDDVVNEFSDWLPR